MSYRIVFEYNPDACSPRRYPAVKDPRQAAELDRSWFELWAARLGLVGVVTLEVDGDEPGPAEFAPSCASASEVTGQYRMVRDGEGPE